MESPRTDLPTLPDDAAALRALVRATLAERDAAVTERDILQAQNDRLRHLLLKLTRMQLGAKSERLPEEQLQLGLEALEQAIAKEDAQAEGGILSCARTMRPSAVRAVGRCRRTCRGSR